jgi:hypothetical protein
MEKTTFQKLAELFGFRVNADAIEELSTNEMDYPDNWDEMSEEEQMAWKEKNGKMKDNSSEGDEPEVKPAPKTRQNARQAQTRGASQPDIQNLLKLNSLIDEIGGFDAYKGLLLNAVEAVEDFQARQNADRDTLVSQIVANSAGQFEEADFENVPVPTLKKKARAYGGHDVTVDYSVLNPQTVKTNKDDIAPLPDVSALFANKKED